ncbi:hypothetical protein AAG565_02725 [Fontimonas sp. SYSU GA230001]|uniref:alpha/beta hydrolase n=1 Tax=Fontimonas sp. SYSU GA230001 TaxID=3142450 RepID=UPI0032B3D342
MSVQLQAPRQHEWLSLVPIAAGLYWLFAGDGGAWLLWALLPGALLLSSGLALALMPGDPRILGLIAGGGALGALLFPFAWYAADLATAFYALLGSLSSLLAAGRLGLRFEPLYEGAQPPQIGSSMDLKAGLDEALLGYFVCTARVPSGRDAERMCGDARQLEAHYRAHGWDADPARMHAAPPPPDEVFAESRRLWGIDYENLRFDSGFQLPAELPGAARWADYEANRSCHVRVLRHRGRRRPWLLCLHGYRMGVPWLDLSLFSPGWLHHRLGFNLVLPVLPLHGPRSPGWRSGDRFLDGDLLDLVYAQMQALWDLRRTLAWLRAQEDEPRIGVLGFSLGGYNAALLAGFERRLDFVVAGIPVIDFAAALWRFLPPMHLRYLVSQGLDEAAYRHLLSPVSPLSFAPLPERRQLHVFAAAGDRIVLPSHPLALGRHWDVPVCWYQGSHLSVRRERTTREVVQQAVERAGWTVE